MNWYYEKDGSQRGPVPVEELLRLLETHEITSATLVWREGMGDWVELSKAGVLSGPTGEEMAVCAHSGTVRPKSEMIPYGSLWISPEHRDVFVENLMAGKEYGGNREGIIPDDYTVPIGDILSRSWNSLSADFWPNVGVTSLVIIMYGVASNIPYLGALAAFFQVPLYAGLYWYFLQKIRGRFSDVSMIFTGFSRQFLQLFLVGLLVMAFTVVCLIPGGIALVIGMVMMDKGASGEAAGAGLAIGGGILVFIPVMYLQVVFMFSSLLCIDRQMNAWPSVVTSVRIANKHWFSCFLFVFVMGLIGIAGVLALCLGLFVAAPLVFLATVHLYEHIFGGRRAEDMLST
jgi:hypothetical protein